MKECDDYTNPLIRDGASQSGRFPPDLGPESVKIDGRTEQDLIGYAYQFASLLNFYDQNNQVDGNWQVFLQQLKDQPEAALSGQLTPQSGLFLAFLRLFQKQQEQLNGLTKKHLDTYFKDVLQISPKKAIAGQVHVLFELAKNLEPSLLKAGTKLKAGKDADGIDLEYQLKEDIIVNHATVEAVKSLLVDETAGSLVHYGEVADSADGMGEEELPEGDKWPAFGRESFPEAEIGFALASPVLWLQEGSREISVTLTLLADDDFDIPAPALQNAFKIYLSGAEEWLGPYFVSPSLKKIGGKFQLQFEINLLESEKAVTFFDSEILEGGFHSLYPVMKVIPDTFSSNYLNGILQGILLENVQISVNVSGIKNLELQNDNGNLDASKPFLPFGPEPVAGATFHLGYEEAFTKRLDNFKVEVDWMDVPSTNLRSYYGSSYSGSLAGLNYSLSSNQFKASLQYRDTQNQVSSKTVDLFNPTNNKSTAVYHVGGGIFSTITKIPQSLINNQLKFASRTKAPSLLQSKYQILPGSKIGPLLFAAPVQRQAARLEKGFISFDLFDDFLHREYRQKYVKATVQYTSGTLYLPREPYQPKIKSISLSYQASTALVQLNLPDADAFAEKEIEFFHLGAFGQREVHRHLFRRLGWLSGEGISLLADYWHQGQLFIGLKNVGKGQTVNLLFQVAEGSANPLKEKEPVSWYVLSDNFWFELGPASLLADGTNGFLKSGVVKINLPSETTTENTWLENGLVWLRATVNKNPDVVCQLIGIHAQAAPAELLAPENHPAHLQQALAAKTISKLVKPNAAIKKIEQPYAGFGGRPVEKDRDYYTRVSERLRHKNRAVTIWDYERLVLEEFPAISKVKCLNHTCETSEMSPGHVTLIVVPDLQNHNAANLLQPRVSKAVLEDVKTFIKKASPSLAEIHVNNPLYEEIQLEFEVAFVIGFEFGFYQKELNRELIEFLSPWSNGKQAEIHFGGTMEKSVLLKFVETRQYVDFVSQFKMLHFRGAAGKTEVESAVATNPRAILVSHSNHIIKKYNG